MVLLYFAAWSSESIVPPRQARTRASWDRVLQEGVALLEAGGYDALTIGALCERAGVTPPTIYARAGSKEQLLLAIYERAMQRIARDERLDPADPRWAAMEPAELVRAAVTPGRPRVAGQRRAAAADRPSLRVRRRGSSPRARRTAASSRRASGPSC